MAPRRTRAEWQIEPSEAQIKAIGSATRVRILRLCNDREWTNKELAERLGLDPSTVHRHVRLLVEAGLLETTGVRQGTSGAYEKPYRSTGLSWKLAIDEVPTDEEAASDEPTLLAAFRQELTEAGNGSIAELARFHLHLADERLTSFVEEIKGVINRYIDDDHPTDGPGHGGIFIVHRLADDERPG